MSAAARNYPTQELAPRSAGPFTEGLSNFRIPQQAIADVPTIAANENIPAALRWTFGLARFARPIARLSPWLLGLFIAYELWEQYQTYKAPGNAPHPFKGTKWTLKLRCKTGDKTFWADGLNACGFKTENTSQRGRVQVVSSGHQGNVIYGKSFNVSGSFDTNIDMTSWWQWADPLQTITATDAPVKWPTSIPFTDPFIIDLPPAPYFYPAIDPFALPIGRPVPTPRPIPYELLPYLVPNPFRSPNEQTQRGPEAAPRVAPTPNTVSISPDGKPSASSSPHELRPPRRGEKERKVRTNIPAAALVRAVKKGLGTVTEGLDALYAIYDALPQELRRWRRPPPQDALLILYRHWTDIDPVQAVKNLAINELEDFAIGKSNNAINRSLRDNPYYRGLRGPNVTQLGSIR